ncbi:MAG: class II glutamine amidotransferase [Aridibacter sp.]
MCRFIAYLGSPIKLEDLLYNPTNSLIKQSYQSKERDVPVNGDGFGIGWYNFAEDSEPCVQTYITPAWSNRNLQRLSRQISAPNIFAHVRAASPGLVVMDTNVHPFQYQNLLWMHNGSVAEFEKIKRPLRASLPDKFYNFIQGTTDSEHAFALFLNHLKKPPFEADVAAMREALVATIHDLDNYTNEAKITDTSFYNFAVTNGKELVVSRYRSNNNEESASLHYSRGKNYTVSPSGEYDLEKVSDGKEAEYVIISSEILTENTEDYPDVPENQTICVREDLSFEIEEIV